MSDPGDNATSKSYRLADSFCVVKDDAQRMAIAGAQAADSVPHIDAIGSTRTVHGPRVDREDHTASKSKRYDFGT